MKRSWMVLGGAGVLALLPFARAQEKPAARAPAHRRAEKKVAKKRVRAHRTPAQTAWARFDKRYDLNKDGKVTWEEYEKVKSGFTALDADHNGIITRVEFDKFAAKMHERRFHALEREVRELRRRLAQRGHPAVHGRRAAKNRRPRAMQHRRAEGRFGPNARQRFGERFGPRFGPKGMAGMQRFQARRGQRDGRRFEGREGPRQGPRFAGERGMHRGPGADRWNRDRKDGPPPFDGNGPQ